LSVLAPLAAAARPVCAWHAPERALSPAWICGLLALAPLDSIRARCWRCATVPTSKATCRGGARAVPWFDRGAGRRPEIAALPVAEAVQHARRSCCARVATSAAV